MHYLYRQERDTNRESESGEDSNKCASPLIYIHIQIYIYIILLKTMYHIVTCTENIVCVCLIHIL